jgi:hypothetical protein
MLESISALQALLGGSFLVLGLISLQWWQQNNTMATIPGPRGYPFVGIGLGMPPHAPKVFREWAWEYGEIFKLRIGWYNWVVINSPEAFKEILDKQVSTLDGIDGQEIYRHSIVYLNLL